MTGRRDRVHDIRLHRDGITLITGFLYPAANPEYGDEITVPIGPSRIRLYVRLGQGAPYGSRIDIDDRMALSWTAILSDDVNEYTLVPFLLDGQQWELEYRCREFGR